MNAFAATGSNPHTMPDPDAGVIENVLRTLELVDAPPEREFDVFTSLTSRILDVPVALVSVVEENKDRQFFKSMIGLDGDWAKRRQTPLTHSFCQYVKRDNRPLVVENAPGDAQVCDNLAIPDLGVMAYLGVPFHGADGAPLGALCAIDSTPRRWKKRHVKIMTDLAFALSSVIRHRAALLRAHCLEG